MNDFSIISAQSVYLNLETFANLEIIPKSPLQISKLLGNHHVLDHLGWRLPLSSVC